MQCAALSFSLTFTSPSIVQSTSIYCSISLKLIATHLISSNWTVRRCPQESLRRPGFPLALALYGSLPLVLGSWTMRIIEYFCAPSQQWPMAHDPTAPSKHTKLYNDNWQTSIWPQAKRTTMIIIIMTITTTDNDNHCNKGKAHQPGQHCATLQNWSYVPMPLPLTSLCSSRTSPSLPSVQVPSEPASHSQVVVYMTLTNWWYSGWMNSSWFIIITLDYLQVLLVVSLYLICSRKSSERVSLHNV